MPLVRHAQRDEVRPAQLNAVQFRSIGRQEDGVGAKQRRAGAGQLIHIRRFGADHISDLLVGCGVGDDP